MLPSKALFMDHVRWLRLAAKAQGLEVLVELDSMAAFVRRGEQHWVLYAQFLAEVDGVTRYFPTFTDTATFFAGWMPHPNSGWPATRDKLVFKRAAAALGLRVPDFRADEAQEMTDVVVKRPSGSFGEHVHGPFRSSRERALQLADGEFYERFIDGEPLKVWYWDGAAVALERDRVPTVTGDGKATLRALVEESARKGGQRTPEKLAAVFERSAALLRFDGASLDDVPAAGHRQRVEFRYGTALMRRRDRENIDLQGNTDERWRDLHAAAPALTSLLPVELRQAALFTVDAIRDAQGRIWFLEMNANPTVHPLAYAPMLKTLQSPQTPRLRRAAAQPA